MTQTVPTQNNVVFRFWQNVKKHWQMYAVVGVAFILLVSAILRALTPPAPVLPQTPFVTTNYDGSHTSFQKVTFSGKSPAVPASFTIYSYAPNDTQESTVVQNLVTNFHLSKQSEGVWLGPQYSLTLNSVDQQYVLGNNSIAATPSGTVVNKAQAITFTQDFVSKYFVPTTLRPMEQNIAYYSDYGDLAESTPEQASLINIPFTPVLDSFPTFFDKTSIVPFTIYINGSNVIEKVVFYPLFISPQPVEKLHSIDVSAAIFNINNNKAAVLLANKTVGGALSFDQITSANLDAVTVEYRTDSASHLIYPFYHFSGQAQNNLGDALSVEIITPAVQTTQ